MSQDDRVRFWRREVLVRMDWTEETEQRLFVELCRKRDHTWDAGDRFNSAFRSCRGLAGPPRDPPSVGFGSRRYDRAWVAEQSCSTCGLWWRDRYL